jgi:hypothetical protein
MTKEIIERLQQQIEDAMGEPINHEDGSEVAAKINKVATLLSSGAACVAESKRLELTKRGAWLRQHKEAIADMKPMVAREFVNTACIDEQILTLRCETNNKALVHCGEFLRSILSLIKADKYQQNV